MGTLSHDDVRRLCGDIPDWKIAQIIAEGATIEDLEIALAWAAGESDVMGEELHPLSGAAALVYDILLADEDAENEERAAPR